jgi:hypothetical protein
MKVESHLKKRLKKKKKKRKKERKNERERERGGGETSVIIVERRIVEYKSKARKCTYSNFTRIRAYNKRKNARRR